MLIGLLAVVCGSSMDAFMKYITQDNPLLPVVAWRYVIGTVITLGLMQVTRARWPSWAGVRFQTMRGALAGLTGVTFFYTLTQIALSEATVMIFCAALLIAPTALVMLKERISLFTIAMTVLGFAGVALAALGGEPQGAPEDGNRLFGYLAGFASAAFYAVGVVMLRKRSGVEDNITVIAFSNFVPCIMLSPFLFQVPLSAIAPIFAPILLAATLGVGTWGLITLAYTRAPAQQLAPLEYTALIWAALFGWFVFGERPGWTLWAGAAVVIAACLAVAFESHFRARREAKTAASDIVH